MENATKVIGNVVHAVKEYVMVIQLHDKVEEDKLRRVVDYFRGEIYQRPPLRSSVKRTLRKRSIYEIEVLEYTGRFALVRVSSDPGTYMRKLAHDMGLLLGVGAHMRELRRTRTGPFKEDETLFTMQEVMEAVTLWRESGDERLLRRVVQPVEVSVVHMPKIMILDTAVDAVAHGANLAAPGVARLTSDVRKGSTVALLTLKGELVALGVSQYDSGEIKNMSRGVVVKVKRVYMPTGVYPQAWRRQVSKT